MINESVARRATQRCGGHAPHPREGAASGFCDGDYEGVEGGSLAFLGEGREGSFVPDVRNTVSA